MKRLVFLLILILVLFLIGYKYYFDFHLKSYSMYGIRFNEYRKEIEIPIIETDWIDQDPRESIWVDTTFLHIGKHIIFEENNISLEIDRISLKGNKVLYVYSRYDRYSLDFKSQDCEIVEGLIEKTNCECEEFDYLW